MIPKVSGAGPSANLPFRVRVWVGPCDVKHYAEKARDLIPGVTEGTEHVLFSRVDAPDADAARALVSDILFGDGGRTRGIEATQISAD